MVHLEGDINTTVTLTKPDGTETVIYGADHSIAQADLFEWWLRVSSQDFYDGAPKVEEYGAHDLEIMGAMLYLLAYKERMAVLAKGQQAPLGSELACWFYVLGKVARLVSDYIAERVGKPDTWHDITFYSMMARRIQEVGTWP